MEIVLTEALDAALGEVQLQLMKRKMAYLALFVRMQFANTVRIQKEQSLRV